MVKPLIFRADASARVGAGHVMRCLALAEAWQAAGGKAVFVQSEEAPKLRERLDAAGVYCVAGAGPTGSVNDALRLSQIASEQGAEWIVVDGYAFGAAYQEGLKARGHRLLFVDDFGHAGSYCADLVLNQNLSAKPELYAARGEGTQLLLGTRFALLRTEFLRHAHVQRPVRSSKTGCHLLVTLGGGDLDNVSTKVIQGMRDLSVPDWQATVVVGAMNPHRTDLEAAIGKDALPIRLEHHTSRLPELMASADLTIAAGGITTWELAFMGVPMLLVALADNQESNVRHLANAGAAVNLGWHAALSAPTLTHELNQLLADGARRAEMSRRARELVDGEGVDRVRMRLEGRPLRMRRVRSGDCRMLWQWANEPGVRNVSFSSAFISWEEHVAWFESRTRSPGCRMLIGVDEADADLGQVRFDWAGPNEADVSVSVSANHRGAGLGVRMLDLAVEDLFRETPVRAVYAHVKPDNAQSLRAFEKAGFRNLGAACVKSCPALRFVRTPITSSAFAPELSAKANSLTAPS